MRILFYGLNFSPELTGIGKYSGEMARWLMENGHDVDVVTAPPYYPAWQVHEGYRSLFYQTETIQHGQNSMRVLRCPLWVPRQVSGLTRVLHLLTFAVSSSLALVWRIFSRPQLLILVVPTLACAPIAAVIGKIGGVKIWIHVQDFEVDAASSIGIVKHGRLIHTALAAESLLLRMFDRASSISPKMVERLVTKGVSQSSARLLQNWVDLSATFPLEHPSVYRVELSLSADTVVLLYSGNMGEKQGLEILVEAARRLREDTRLLFVLAGDGAARSRIEATCRDMSNILWLPLQPLGRFNDFLGLADIHLLPQRADAADLVMPSKLTGMLASGRAVIGTAAAGTQLGDVLDEVGARVEPGDTAALCSAIVTLADNQEERARLGRLGRNYAVKYLDQNTIMATFVEEATSLTQPDI